jgi:hypothetical protein
MCFSLLLKNFICRTAENNTRIGRNSQAYFQQKITKKNKIGTILGLLLGAEECRALGTLKNATFLPQPA